MRFLRALLALFAKPKPTPVPVPPVVVPPYVAPPVAAQHGINTHRNSAEEIQAVADLGCRHARVTVYTANPVDVQSWAWKIPAMEAQGITPLLCVHDFDQRNNAIVQMVNLTTTFPNRTWQVGNEANAYPDYWLHDPAQYASLMQSLLVICPNARFVGMGMAHGNGATDYLKGYLAAGGPLLDAWCIHLYGVPVNIDAIVRETQAVLKGKMPLWITEYGIDGAAQIAAWGPQTPAQLDAEQRLTVQRVTEAAGPLGVSRTYCYAMWDDQDYGFGITRKDDAHRPSWDALQLTLTRSTP